MRRVLVGGPLLLLVLTAATAAAAAAPQRITTVGTVGALAADGSRVAFVVVRSPRDCDRVRVWNTATGGVSKLGRRTHCVDTSTGRGIASLALAGTRALWLHYVGGNQRDWSAWTASTTRPLPRRLADMTVDVDSPAPMVVGHGDASRFGELLPYAVGRNVVALRVNGTRALSWLAPDRVVALGANGGGLAVALADGRVLALDGGAVVDEWDGSPAATAVFVTGSGVVAQRGSTLYAYGSPTLTKRMPTGARLMDSDNGRAVYVTRGVVHVMELRWGADRSVAHGTAAQLEGSHLIVAGGPTIRVTTLAGSPR
jgi:hypothetical protein